MLFGHTDKEELFKALVLRDKLRHAYLFFGDEGLGKKLFALRLAHFLETGNFEVSNELLVDARIFEPEVNGTLGIEEALKIRAFLWETPLKSKRRFAIVNGAESLTFEAQSALLKVVEESPHSSLIVFVAEGADSLLPPLASRLIRVYFRRFSTSEIIKILTSFHGVDTKSAERFAKNSFGRIRRALMLAGKLEVSKTEATLKEKVIEREAALWSDDPRKHFEKLRILIDAEVSLKRYNLNETIQKKALEYKLGFPL